MIKLASKTRTAHDAAAQVASLGMPCPAVTKNRLALKKKVLSKNDPFFDLTFDS